jgi:HPt (histidine-containing phosphotransfer) domain-containing protein
MKSGIDPDILRRVVGNDPEFLREVLEDFVCHGQSEIIAIRAAFVSQDAEQMKIPTHRFKGSASHMGAHQVVEVCTRLEAARLTRTAPRSLYVEGCFRSGRGRSGDTGNVGRGK